VEKAELWGQIFNLGNGGEIEEMAKEGSSVGKKDRNDSKSEFSRIEISPHSTLNGSGVLQDLPLVVIRFFLGSRFGFFLDEFVINPDEISKQQSE